MINKKILIVEDDEDAAFGYTQILSKTGAEINSVTTLEQAKNAIASRVFDAVLLDLNLPDGNAMEWLPIVRKDNQNTAIIIITAISDVATAVKSMKTGADNYLTKPINMDELKIILEKYLELGELKKKHAAHQRILKKSEPFFGENPAMQEAVHKGKIAAGSDSIVLLQGKTGTGKGVFARWIHDKSRRRTAPFVELNCSMLRGEMLRSELFGHVKGAFTSAIKDREGLIEAADCGTLFLDEIGDMDMELQAQLLNVLEDKKFRRLGENRVRTSDFRLLCATHRYLEKWSAEGKFRDDLFFRINIFPISLPSLDRRREDVPELAEHLLESLGYRYLPISKEISHILTNRNWPGNVRELKNMLERAMLFSQGGTITSDHFLERGSFRDIKNHQHSVKVGIRPLEEIELEHIQNALDFFKGDKEKASNALGISLSSLYRKLPKLPKS
ncbi:MAG: sigma-54 dependent transcriptional regulator [bacterium]